MMEEAFDKQANTGVRHLVNATKFSVDGLVSCVKHESAFRQELLAMAIVIPTGAWFATNLGVFIALCCACLFVLVVELLNSGIEAAVDRVGLEHHEMAKLAKDYGSAAVMLSIAIAGLLWGYIILPHFFPIT